MGESFALWNWRSVVDFRLLSGVRPTTTLSWQDLRLDPHSDRLFLFAFFSYEIFYVLRQVPLSTHAPRVSERAPDFLLLDQNAMPVGLSDLLSGSKAVVLIFYRGFW